MSEDYDSLCARVFELGVRHGLISRDKVIAWADGEIAERRVPEPWLIDLSMSASMHEVDLLGVLRLGGGNVDREITFRTMLSLMCLPLAMTFDDAKRVASMLYRLARDCFDWDWSSQLLRDADLLDDEIALVAGAYVGMTPSELCVAVAAFVTRNRSADIPDELCVASFNA